MADRRKFIFAAGACGLLLPFQNVLAQSLVKEELQEFKLSLPKIKGIKVFEIKSPKRLVIDLPMRQVSEAKKIPLGWPAVVQNSFIVRVAQNTPEISRIVLEVKDETSFKWSFDKEVLKVFIAFKVISLEQSEPEASLQSKSRDKFTIVLDPGHGGVDPGAIGKLGGSDIFEKNIVLQIASQCAHQLRSNPKVEVLLTRDSDKSMSLKDRVAFARNKKADLFISVHADAFMTSKPKGASVFILSEGRASSEAGKFLARTQNEVDFIHGLAKPEDDNLGKTLLSLAQSGTMLESRRAASYFLRSLAPVTPLHSSVINEASFAVLTSPDVPSLLLETGFMSNAEDLANLADKGFQRKISEQMSLAVEKYISTLQA